MNRATWTYPQTRTRERRRIDAGLRRTAGVVGSIDLARDFTEMSSRLRISVKAPC